ncbi:MAG: hypothetical protein MMC33_005071 [Icmadophila ericetorum]|nr:hypothetical protein [Icmadophila ericetorum]
MSSSTTPATIQEKRLAARQVIDVLEEISTLLTVIKELRKKGEEAKRERERKAGIMVEDGGMESETPSA